MSHPFLTHDEEMDAWAEREGIDLNRCPRCNRLRRVESTYCTRCKVRT